MWNSPGHSAFLRLWPEENLDAALRRAPILDANHIKSPRLNVVHMMPPAYCIGLPCQITQVAPPSEIIHVTPNPLSIM